MSSIESLLCRAVYSPPGVVQTSEVLLQVTSPPPESGPPVSPPLYCRSHGVSVPPGGAGPLK